MNETLQKRLLSTFHDEAEDRLATMSGNMDALERDPADEATRAAALESLMRATHSLKGAAKVVRLGAMETACQQAESMFSGLVAAARAPSAAELGLLRTIVDTLGDLPRDPTAALPEAVSQRLADAFRAFAGETDTPPAAGAAPDVTAASAVDTPPPKDTADRALLAEDDPAITADTVAGGAGTVRVPVSRLTGVMADCEDLLVNRLAVGERVREVHHAASRISRWRGRSGALRVSLERLRGAGRGATLPADLDTEALAGLVEDTGDLLANLEHDLLRLNAALDADHRALSGAVDGLLSGVREMLMLPCATILGTLPRLARDLARDLGRELQVRLEGEHIEADRRILEALRDPLVHLVRNAIDHGIEPPAERTRDGKPRTGVLIISAAREEGNRLAITVEDDGRGIDPERVRADAVRRGEPGADALDAAGLQALLFRSGFSTREAVTEISGRGLGLAIAEDEVERLGGDLTLTSEPGRGTRVHIVVPLDLATFRGTVVRVADREVVLPTTAVHRVIRVSAADIRRAGSRDTLAFEGTSASLVRMAGLLGVEEPAASAPETRSTAVVLGEEGARVACLVDAVLGEQEITVKGLGSRLRRVPNIAGIAAFGSGRMAPLLHVPDLLVSAAAPAPAYPGAPGTETAARVRSVLVAEDSITARTLLEAILRGAGWRVRSVADGADALEALRHEPFDLLVSDVEMPRLDGVELTRRVRADAELSNLPVVLVTARGSREDRERGIQAGANAYVIKSEFDQGDLLQLLERLA